ncbi:phosphatidylserine decarboxylase [Maribrevibacterium harenarium]|uniref:Phosphatidylserine decarboxylase proenzyme n=1 Tax=Maribrevibacterium harenarium TaxID=2589817 RepID=A0A501WV73_9GAMM|nr:archaetidylserine decarboxylase [Maribrevibacterium harenarium]TPE52014.1 phosphatidylserine decarboxylase [Maribrevibacterium harenarium]
MNKDQLFAIAQHLTPQKMLSRGAGKLAECELGFVKNTFIKQFVKKYQVDMSEAAEPNPTAYRNFNDFFTRALKPNARPIVSSDNLIACPADGAVSQIGDIEYGTIYQAKGHYYGLTELLGGDAKLSDQFLGGKFATIYLSPKDYHRVHMPYPGKLVKMIHVPGKLFSVNKVTAEQIPNVFARNERTVCVFETDIGPMVVILVGAMIVASIETVWAGQVTPFSKKVQTWDYQDLAQVELKKGEEMGRFKLGSTAIVLFPKNTMEWSEELKADSPTRMGMALGQIKG